MTIGEFFALFDGDKTGSQREYDFEIVGDAYIRGEDFDDGEFIRVDPKHQSISIKGIDHWPRRWEKEVKIRPSGELIKELDFYGRLAKIFEKEAL